MKTQIKVDLKKPPAFVELVIKDKRKKKKIYLCDKHLLRELSQWADGRHYLSVQMIERLGLQADTDLYYFWMQKIIKIEETKCECCWYCIKGF